MFVSSIQLNHLCLGRIHISVRRVLTFFPAHLVPSILSTCILYLTCQWVVLSLTCIPSTGVQATSGPCFRRMHIRMLIAIASLGVTVKDTQAPLGDLDFTQCRI